MAATYDSDARYDDGELYYDEFLAASWRALGSGVTERDTHGIVGVWHAALASQVGDVVDVAAWKVTLDPQATPVGQLRWLGLWVGEKVDADLDEASQRDQVDQAPGQRFATLDAFRDAAKPWLSGEQSVRVEERTTADGAAGAWHVRVTTLDEETADAGLVAAALRRAKPAGVQVHHRTTRGWLWGDVVDAYATWQATLDAHPTWDDLVVEPPP
jgi:hypothetical protein